MLEGLGVLAMVREKTQSWFVTWFAMDRATMGPVLVGLGLLLAGIVKALHRLLK
jgi:hypothetical protein